MKLYDEKLYPSFRPLDRRTKRADLHAIVELLERLMNGNIGGGLRRIVPLEWDVLWLFEHHARRHIYIPPAGP